MRYNGFCFEPEFKWCGVTDLSIDCAVQEVDRGMDSFGPEFERLIVEMEHTSGGFADCSIVPFDVSILLGGIWRVGFAFDSFLFKK